MLRVIVVSREFPAVDEPQRVRTEPSLYREYMVGMRAMESGVLQRPGDEGLNELGPADNIAAPDSSEAIFGLVLRTSRVTVDEQWAACRRYLPSGLSPQARVHLVDRHRARRFLQRQGGGIIEDGAYVLHPKRDGVLVPLRTFHRDLLQEMESETYRVLAMMGAKRAVIETIDGVTFTGELVSSAPLALGRVDVSEKSKGHRKKEWTWRSPTFKPDTALEGCVFVQDNGAIMSLVGQRRGPDLGTFKQSAKLDTSFGVSIDALGVFSAKGAWAETSNYSFEVEFFPRPS